MYARRHLLTPSQLTPITDIDPAPTTADLSSATTLLTSALTPEHAETIHPSIPTTYTPHFSPWITAAHNTIASTGLPRAPGTGIDLSRYEAPSLPTSTSSSIPSSSSPSDAHTYLSTALTSTSYLTQRALSLSLLERFGKNAWLVSNSQIEYELRAIETELLQVRDKVEAVEERRRGMQEGVRGEVEGLESAWREGVGRAVEVEVAGWGVEREIRGRRVRAVQQN